MTQAAQVFGWWALTRPEVISLSSPSEGLPSAELDGSRLAVEVVRHRWVYSDGSALYRVYSRPTSGWHLELEDPM